MSFLSILLNFFKKNKNELLIIKILVLIIINTWLLVIFWKIIILGSGANIINNNIAVLKMQTLLQPFLQILGLDVLNPNTIKMVVITVVIILSNLAVLYFSQIMAFILLGISARYSYKAYNNYINKDTLNYYGFEKLKELKLTAEVKNEIFNNFLIEKSIKDESLIGFLQHKLNNTTSDITKNEFISTLNINLLEYKQQILGKLVLEQREQLQIVSKKPTLLESLDVNTLLKIGGIVIIVGLIALGGYYYFSTDAVKTAGEIGKKVGEESLKGAQDVSKIALEHSNINTTQLAGTYSETANMLVKELAETRVEVAHLADKVIQSNNIIEENVNQVNKFINDTAIKNLKFSKEAIEGQINFINESKTIVNESKSYNESMKNLTELTNQINIEVKQLNENASNINLILKGGEVKTLNNITGLEEINKFDGLVDIAKGAASNSSYISAILEFIGAGGAVNQQLNENVSNSILQRIRAITGRENVYEIHLNNEDLTGIEPVDNENVTDIEQLPRNANGPR